MRGGKILRGCLDGIAVLALVIIVLLPLIDLLLARLFWKSVPQAGPLVDHAVLILAFIAAAIASLDKRHLSLAAGDEARQGPLRRALGVFATAVAVTAQTSLFWAALSLVFRGFDPQAKIGLIPTWALAAVMPLCFLLMALFTVHRAGRGRRLAAASGLVLGSLLAVSSLNNFATAAFGSAPVFLETLSAAVQVGVKAAALPLGGLFILAAIFGAPIFTVLGGIAVLLYVAAGSFIELGSSEAYNLLRSTSITALPLFGLAGFLLAESGAGKRLVAVFRELFGWVRGGEAIVAVLACAFFSTFTGINGVTIIALGGLLVTVLSEAGGFSAGTARGLVTASGDIGLLLPPSAAVIVYGINAQFIYGESSGFDVAALFKGALVPGILLVAAMCVAGVIAARRSPVERRVFDARRAGTALKPALLELLVPLIAAVLFFSGYASLREIGAFCVLYIAVVEAAVKRELGFRSFIAVLRRSLPVIGGTLIIIAAARGLSFYIIDADIPSAFTSWISARVSSPLVFLLALNVFLLAVGCLMDIFSAILVVAPFVIPLGAAFGINPIHFGVVFIMNLCIGFLTPTVGMNIFLASYAFKKPVPQVVKEVWPFLLVQIAVLLVVTYVPGLSTMLLKR